MEVLKMQCKHKDCEENWASDDQWAFDEDGYCIRCKDKTNISLRKGDSISKTYTIKCLKCNMISFKENWNGTLRNMLASRCYRKRCTPNSLVHPLYWWEDGTPIGHNQIIKEIK